MYMHSSLSYILGGETTWRRNDEWGETTSGGEATREITSWGRND